MYTCGNTSKSRKTRFPSVDTPAKMPDNIKFSRRAGMRTPAHERSRQIRTSARRAVRACSSNKVQTPIHKRSKNTDCRPPYPAAHVNMLELGKNNRAALHGLQKIYKSTKFKKKYLKKFFTCVNIVSSVSRSGEIGRRSRLKICRSSLCVSVRVRPSAPLFEKTSSPRSFLFSQNGENVSPRRIFSLCMPGIFVPFLINRGF